MGKAAQAELALPGRVASISTDTRTLAPGQVFWALRGERHDAHDFLTADLAEKSFGWVIETGRHKTGPRPARVLSVPDTLKALQALAAHHRRRFDIPVAGITGSNGKTTTKEMLRSVCARVGPVCATQGNLNNQIGLPLSLLELTSQHRYGVFEMGASRPGDIAGLGAIAKPTVGVLLNIGPAHLESFGSLEATLRAKSELIDHVSPEGKVVVNTDDPLLATLEARLGRRAVGFGTKPSNAVRITDGSKLVIDGREEAVRLRSFGSIGIYNAAAAAAAAWAMGIDARTIVQGLEDHHAVPMRMERRPHPSGCEIVLDAYNANPASMKAAISAFLSEFQGKEAVLVLGDMKELGADSQRLHRELGKWLVSQPLEAVYLAGQMMENAFDILLDSQPDFRVRYAESSQDWLDELRTDLGPRTALLLKASRAMKFETILERLGG